MSERGIIRLTRILLVSVLAVLLVVTPVLALKGDQGKPQQPAKPQQAGAKHKATVERNLGILLSKKPYKDPFVPAFVHAVKRYLAGAQNVTEFDKIIQAGLRSRKNLDRAKLQTLVTRWDALPQQFKANYFPSSMINLDVRRPIDLKELGGLMLQAGASFKFPPRGMPIDRQRWGNTIRPTPEITSVRTSGLDFALVLQPGREFALVGRNFSPTAAQNRIQILRERAGAVGPMYFDILNELTPGSASATELRAIAPAALAPGNYCVRVVVDGINSNVWRAYVVAPPVPAPTLDTISPGSQYPGKRVVLTGSRFAADSIVALEFLERDGVSYTRIGRPAVRLLGATQLEFQIPQETWPGDYRLAVRNTGSSLSLWRTFKVLAPHYRVAFEQIRCMDESDPEWAGDDEVYSMFTGTTEGVSLGKRTREISGFSDGVLKSYGASDGAAFRPDGSAEPVKAFLIISASLFEGDDSEAAAVVDLTEVLSSIGGSLAGAIAILYGATALIGGAIATIAGLVILGIGALIALLTAGDDALGQQVASYAATNLQTLTAASGDTSNRMYFTNDDDTGSYQITYRVVRSEP